MFENPEFAAGTRRVAEAVAASKAFSIAGGGDTLAAIEQFGVGDKISYISTGGGAFLEFLEGKKLPAVATLEEQRAARSAEVPCRRTLAAVLLLEQAFDTALQAAAPAVCLPPALAGLSAPARARARHGQGRRIDDGRVPRALGRARARHGRHALRARARGRRARAAASRSSRPAIRRRTARASRPARGCSSSRPSAGATSTLICLISGGGSSLASQPLPPLTFEQKRAAANFLIRQGADIREINCVRKHLSRLKGGRLAAAAHPARVLRRS